MGTLSALNKFRKSVHWPICRAYARFVIKDKPADGFFRLICSFQFWAVYRFWPNLVNPERFSEKMWSRMLHERDPLFTLISDKLKVRNYVAGKVGDRNLIPLLWSGDRAEDIPFDDLPSRFVIKTNHGAGYIIIVKDKEATNFSEIRKQLRSWLEQNYCQDKYIGTEWGYRNIKPTIMVESFLEEHGKSPVDYKFWCFSGRVEFVSVHVDRFETHRVKWVNRDFKPFQFELPMEDRTVHILRPENFEKMLDIAESLAQSFDFIRVDLYTLNGKIFFGELTPYAGGAGMALLQKTEDCIFGKKWKSI